MRASEIIRKKRDGGELSKEEIKFFVSGLANQSIAAEQAAALAMAIFFRSMTDDEIAALTLAMARSGEIMDWSRDRLDGPIADKHSTGGVGDKVSFILAPILAACGCFVPMISGRGLGHSGGTLDKIECLPGYQTRPDKELFRATVKSVGCAIIGQTDVLAPADNRLYAIRDVTATVESIPLITASILSKKIAGGNDALVMDIKTGSGAFMPSREAARALARAIVATGARCALPTRAVITDMDQPLGRTAGNAVEILEVVDFLRNGKREERLNQVVFSLCVEILRMTGVEPDADAAKRLIESVIMDGRAADKFAQMVAALGGPEDVIENCESYVPEARCVRPVFAGDTGYISKIDARRVGMAIVGLGGGRATIDDTLDLSVGFIDIAPIGAAVDDNTPLAIVCAANEADLNRASDEYRDACVISEAPPPPQPVIHETIV